MPQNTQIPYRIHIGVTGHRTLPDLGLLNACLESFLASGYLNAFTHEASNKLTTAAATPIAFSVISPLAEGADRLVARSVLAKDGLLEVVLPMPREEYENDFDTAESRSEFTNLLAHSHRMVELDCGVATNDPDYRKRAYRCVGEEVVKRCDILVAMWDGQPSRGMGGTAEIVELAITSGRPVLIISTSKPGHAELKNGGVLNADFFEEIDSFNLTHPEEAELNIYIDNACVDLFSSNVGDLIPSQLKAIVRARLMPSYCKASLKAKYFQDQFNATGTQGYAFSTLSVFVMALAVVFNLRPFISLTGTVLELLLLIILFEMIHRVEHERVHPGWLEHRALAERLRIAFYFVACGEQPETSVNRWTIHHRDRTWVDRVYNEIIYSLPLLERPAEPPLQAYRDFIANGWLQGQIDYHLKKSDREHKKNQNLKRLASLSFILAIAISCIHLLFAVQAAQGHHAEGAALIAEEILSVFAITLPAAGAAFSGYRSLMEQSRLAARSKAMAVHLNRMRQYPAPSDPNAFRRFLDRIEDVMLIESEDWLALMEHAELERIA